MGNPPSAKDLIKPVLKPHVDLAIELLKKVKSASTGDPTYRFQIAAVIILLSGIDKALSLTMQLLYIGGRIERSWLNKNHGRIEPGFIECARGLTAKLYKLKELGLDLTELVWLVELRNSYIHSVSVKAGYSVSLSEKGTIRLELRVSGPSVNYLGEPLLALSVNELRKSANKLILRLGRFVDRTGWKEKWKLVTKRISKLPANPAPEYSLITSGDISKIHEAIGRLNRRYVGAGFELLLKR